MEEYFETDMLMSPYSQFGYFEKDDIVVWIYVRDEVNNEEARLSNILLDLIAKILYNSNIVYTVTYLKNISAQIKEMVYELKAKNINLNKSKCSFMILMSNKTTYMAISIGNILLRHIREDKEIFKSNLDNKAYKLFLKKELTYEDVCNSNLKYDLTNYIGIEKQTLNIIGEMDLKLNDKLIMQGVEAWSKNALDLIEDTSIITAIKLNEKKEKQKLNMSYFSKMLSFLLILSLGSFYISNNFRISRYTKLIQSHMHNLEIYKKNNSVQNIYSEITEIEDIYKNMYKQKLLYIPKSEQEKYMNNKEKLLKLKEKVEEYYSIKEKENKGIAYLKEYKYPDALEIFKNLLARENIFSKRELERLITESNDLVMATDYEKKAKEFINNGELKKGYDELKNAITIYTKHGMQDYIDNVLAEKVRTIGLDMEKLSDKASELVDQGGKYLETSFEKSLECFNNALRIYENIGNKEMISFVNGKISDIEKRKKYGYDNILKLVEECNLNIHDKKYRQALDCLLDVKNDLKVYGQKEKLEEINRKIKNVKEMLRISFSKKPKDADSKPKIDKNEVLKSIKLSVQEGDECIKSSDWDKAIVEYTRAINFSKKINLNNDDMKKLKLKLEFAIKKSKSAKSSWWSKWF